jgi:hypothetical protein
VADATTSVLLAAFLKLLIHFGFAFWTVHGLSSTGVYFLLDVSAFDFVIPIALVVVAMVKTHPAAAL